MGIRLSTFTLLLLPQRYVFSSKSQLDVAYNIPIISCCCYHKGTYFQANHNGKGFLCIQVLVVVATTKVRIFKQITTRKGAQRNLEELLLLPQRYVFSSKSQHPLVYLCVLISCCCYHKGTYFQANHNADCVTSWFASVVVATTKVRIFKQITTSTLNKVCAFELLLLPQRYVFSSKSQPQMEDFRDSWVVVATTKVRIFKQITTCC